jgi:hypothetical protein|tara:strand:+ start:19336 stop:19440 length:105 start_codon:yes stop_codon:yes gene_type:complete
MPLKSLDVFDINALRHGWRAEADETENYVYAIAL